MAGSLKLCLLLTALGLTAATCPHEGSLARWSDVSTWSSGSLPVEGDDVAIGQDILIDVVTPDLANMTIEAGFKLVFDPVAESVKLSVDSILVLGELWIGAIDCPFEGNAEIELLGLRDDTVVVEVNGAPHEKAILVPSGGVLELHGAEKLVWTRLAGTIPATTDEMTDDYVVVTLQDDVSSWSVGDTIVISSTDYDFEQAEEFELQECSDCAADQVKLLNEFEFTHWGETTNDVPMAAEVGMLTRNVRIYGRMEDACYGDNKCDDFDIDTYGGHIKMFSGFQSARITNIEVFNMGQNSRLGSYPIHFHLCGDVSSMAEQPVVKFNSIHHTFARCLTIHGTSGLYVEGNFAHDHYGHCYFLEDGGELDTVLVGNVGIGTRLTDIIISDEDEAATFWITNPSTTLRDNVAGGSQGYGFWYVFPRLPIGPSAAMDILIEDQALRTPLAPFENNVAHSNRVYGLRFDDILDDDGSIDGGFDYNPRVDPLDAESERVPVLFDGFTAYKNYKSVRVRLPSVTMNNFKIAESVEGVRFSDSSPGMKRLTNSLIVGETENKGEPERRIRLLNGTRVWWDRSVRMGGKDRSLPIIGVIMHNAPVYLENVRFALFETNILRPSGAIGIKRKHQGYTSPVNSVSQLSFDFLDPDQGNRFYDADFGRGFEDEYGTINTVLHDNDGSLTTFPGATVVKPYDFLLNTRCAEVPQWNMHICPAKFTKLKLCGMTRRDTFVTRNDQSSYFAQYNKGGVSYALNSQEPYIFNFNSTVPSRMKFVITGIESGVSQVVGICIGQGVQPQRLRGDVQQVSSYAELTADGEESSRYFLDSDVGVLFFRFASSEVRDENTESECPGSDGADTECPTVKFKLAGGSHNDGDCSQRAYPTYQSDLLSADGALTTPIFT